MKYYVEAVKIEEFIIKCKGYIQELEDERKIMNELVAKTKWKGNARDALLLKYQKTIDDIKEIIENLLLYINFMELVLKNYGEGYDDLKKRFLEMVERIEAERLKNEL